jgi:6-phosphogluconolactonase (cycloisomerase 2 family)
MTKNGSTIATLSQWENTTSSTYSQKIILYSLSAGVWTTSTLDIPTLTNQTAGPNAAPSSLAFSQDGTTLIVGCSSNGTYSSGAVFVLKYQNAAWSLLQTITNPNGLVNYENFGIYVSLSPDGSTLAIIGNSIYIYRLSAGQYTYITTLVPNSAGVSWITYSAYITAYLSQFMLFSQYNSRLFIGNPNGNLGIVYTFSCYQNPNLSLINTGGGSYLA